MNDKILDSLIVLNRKETLLSEIIAWLKGKGLWEECAKSLGVEAVKREAT